MPRARQSVAHLDVDKLSSHPANVRQDLGDLTDLARSIREQGIIDPLIVTQHPDGGYLVLDGHRRLGAAKLAGFTRVPAIVRHHVDDPAEQTITMLATDVHKRTYTPLERAHAYQSLINRGLNMSQIARRVGTAPSQVSYYCNLLLLDNERRDQVEAGELPVGEAIAAVREERQAERIATGRPERGRPRGHFSDAHPLAPLVAELCSHTGLLGGVGCGPCWEKAIRADQERLSRGSAA